MGKSERDRRGPVSVSLGCCDSPPQTRRLKQQFISHGSGGCESRTKVPLADSVPGESPLPGLLMATFSLYLSSLCLWLLSVWSWRGME